MSFFRSEVTKMFDIAEVAEEFRNQSQQGYDDAEIVRKLFSKGIGDLILSRVLANERKIPLRDAQLSVLKWTKDVEIERSRIDRVEVLDLDAINVLRRKGKER